MIARLLLAAVVVAPVGATHAGSVLAARQHAVEVPPSQLVALGGDGGSLELAACGHCPRRRFILAADSVYVVNGRAATSAELAAALEHARSSAATGRAIAAVFFHATSMRVERVELVAPIR